MSYVLPNGSLITIFDKHAKVNYVKGVLFLTPKQLIDDCSIKVLVLDFENTKTLSDKKLLEIDAGEETQGYKVITATSIKNMQELKVEFLKYKSNSKVIKNYFLKELIYTKVTQAGNRLSPIYNYINRLTIADLSQDQFDIMNFYREHLLALDTLSQAFYEEQIKKSKSNNSMLVYE